MVLNIVCTAEIDMQLFYSHYFILHADCSVTTDCSFLLNK